MTEGQIDLMMRRARREFEKAHEENVAFCRRTLEAEGAPMTQIEAAVAILRHAFHTTIDDVLGDLRADAIDAFLDDKLMTVH